MENKNNLEVKFPEKAAAKKTLKLLIAEKIYYKYAYLH